MSVTDEILAEADNRMSKSLEALRRDLASIRTSRATPALVERIKVDYYGTPTPLVQLAAISVPEPRTLLIQPWDRNAIGAIEKAILSSDLGITPSNDGRIIRLVFPPLTEERRRELVKIVKKRVEEGRVAIRNIRRDALEGLRKAEREKQISQDEERRAMDKLQKLTDSYIERINKIGEEKEAEIMEE